MEKKFHGLKTTSLDQGKTTSLFDMKDIVFPNSPNKWKLTIENDFHEK